MPDARNSETLKHTLAYAAVSQKLRRAFTIRNGKLVDASRFTLCHCGTLLSPNERYHHLCLPMTENLCTLEEINNVLNIGLRIPFGIDRRSTFGANDRY